MKIITLSLDLHREDAAGVETTYEVEVECGRDPGRTSGPPEDCYPPEEHFEVVAVFGPDGKRIDGFELTEKEVESLSVKAAEEVADAEDCDDNGGDDDDE